MLIDSILGFYSEYSLAIVATARRTGKRRKDQKEVNESLKGNFLKHA